MTRRARAVAAVLALAAVWPRSPRAGQRRPAAAQPERRPFLEGHPRLPPHSLRRGPAQS